LAKRVSPDGSEWRGYGSGSLFAFMTTRLLCHNWTMIVTVIAMCMMQLTMREIIDMICMRNPLVPAINMIASALHRRTGSRILLTDGEHMLIVMLPMREVQMPLMLDGNMPTLRTVRMDMFCMNVMLCHRSFSFQGSATCPRKQRIAYLVLVLPGLSS
jgi:hypothetical protein